MYVFPMYYNVIISYSFTTAIPPPSLQTAEETWTTNLSPAILNILPHFHFSLRHIAVHALSPLTLWYWCNMPIQLLSFKYDACHKELDPKSAATSWNVTLSCLLSSRHTIPHGQLRMHISSFYELLREIAHSAYVNSSEDPCIHYWNYF